MERNSVPLPGLQVIERVWMPTNGEHPLIDLVIVPPPQDAEQLDQPETSQVPAPPMQVPQPPTLHVPCGAVQPDQPLTDQE